MAGCGGISGDPFAAVPRRLAAPSLSLTHLRSLSRTLSLTLTLALTLLWGWLAGCGGVSFGFFAAVPRRVNAPRVVARFLALAREWIVCTQGERLVTFCYYGLATCRPSPPREARDNRCRARVCGRHVRLMKAACPGCAPRRRSLSRTRAGVDKTIGAP
jgi:hypothetical protein